MLCRLRVVAKGGVMGAGTCIGFGSARALWRKIGHHVARDNPASETVPPLLVRLLFDGGKGVDLGAVPVRTRVSAAPARVVAREATELLKRYPDLGRRLDVCVSEQAGRHVAAAARVHFMGGAYPPGSFCRMADGTLLTSPELTFLQLARLLDDVWLVTYGYELCGYYARGEEGFCSCPALTSVARIGRYLDRLERVRAERGQGMPPGIRRARRVLGWVLDGAASPEEAIASMVLTLPRKRGGFGLPPGRLNRAVPLSTEVARLFGIDSFVCDASWEGRRVAFEYQGWQHKIRSRQTVDLRKGNVLMSDDWTLVQANRAILSSQELMEEVAATLSRALGVQWEPPDAVVRTRQLRLRNGLLAELGPGGVERLG